MIIQKLGNNEYAFKGFAEEDLDWKNFAAEKKGQFTPTYPNFDIYIPEDLANELRDMNVNVKLTPPKKPGDSAEYRVNVKINLKYYEAPEVYIREADGSKKPLDEMGLYGLQGKKIDYGEMIVRVNCGDNTDRYNGLYANVLGVKLRKNPFDDDYPEQEYPC